MALHMIRTAPTFTKAMRGYDMDEVDEYLDARRESDDHHAEVMEQAETARRALSAEVAQLRQRVAELEACVLSETPRSIAALGERLTLVLEEAEAGAHEAVRAAREEAEALLGTARAVAEEERRASVARTAEAEQRAAARIGGAEEQAAAVEAAARLRAGGMVADAEQRALARRGEIEAWVERVRAHIEGEEARAAREFARARAARAADLADLRLQHDQVVASLVEMGHSLRRTVEAARSSVPGGVPVPTGPYDDDAISQPDATLHDGLRRDGYNGGRHDGDGSLGAGPDAAAQRRPEGELIAIDSIAAGREDAGREDAGRDDAGRDDAGPGAQDAYGWAPPAGSGQGPFDGEVEAPDAEASDGVLR